MDVLIRGARTSIFILIFDSLSGLALAGPENANLGMTAHEPVTTSASRHYVSRNTFDPSVWLEQKVVANDGKPYDDFGAPVAISGDVAFVGQSGRKGSAVYVLVRKPDGSLKLTQKLTVGGAGLDSSSIAVSGATAVIGDRNATVDGNMLQGAAYVFTQSDGIWRQTATLTASNGAPFDQFGGKVAIQDSTIMVGDALATVDGNKYQGAVYVFTKSNGTWVQAQKLTASDGTAYGFFGNVVMGGKTAFIGATHRTPQGIPLSGAVYIYSDSSGTWAQAQKVSAPSGAGEKNDFGALLGVSGNALLVGASSINGLIAHGGAWIFTKTNGIWTLSQRLNINHGVEFGNVAIAGNTAIIGDEFATVGREEGRGKVYVFKESPNGAWNEAMTLVASDGYWFDQYGVAIAMDDDTMMIGSFASIYAPNGDASFKQGAVYFYELANLDLAVDAPETVEPGQNYFDQVIATNKADDASPPVSLVVPVPPEASFVSASATQGDCGYVMRTVTCNFGNIAGNAGVAKANITLKNQHVAPGTIKIRPALQRQRRR